MSLLPCYELNSVRVRISANSPAMGAEIWTPIHTAAFCPRSRLPQGKSRGMISPVGSDHLAGIFGWFPQPRMYRQVLRALAAPPQDVPGQRLAIPDRVSKQHRRTLRTRGANKVPVDLPSR